MGGAGVFTAVGYIKNSNVKAEQDKDGTVTRSIEAKVIIPEPLDENGKAMFRATIRDLAEVVGERIILSGQTEQLKLPLDGAGAARREAATRKNA